MFRQVITLLVAVLISIMAATASAAETDVDRARQAVEKRDFKLAESILEDHLGDNSSDSEARFLYARVLSWQRKYKDAIEQFDTLLQLEPANADYLLARGNTYEWMGRREDALRDLQKAREISPEYRDIWRAEISYLVRAGDRESVEVERAHGGPAERPTKRFFRTAVGQGRWLYGAAIPLERWRSLRTDSPDPSS